MSESKYSEARRAGYLCGFEDGMRNGLGKARDAFWCGVAAALATWPLAAVVWVLWRVL